LLNFECFLNGRFCLREVSHSNVGASQEDERSDNIGIVMKCLSPSGQGCFKHGNHRLCLTELEHIPGHEHL